MRARRPTPDQRPHATRRMRGRVRPRRVTASLVSSRRSFALLGVPALTLLVGAVVRWQSGPHPAQLIWMTGAAIAGAPIVVRSIRDAFRGRFASDMIAALSISAAITLSQPLVALIIVLMLRGGELLERHAEGRASDAVRALEKAAPETTHRVTDAGVVDVAVASVAPDDLLLMRPGEVIPCDGTVVSGQSSLDTSSLTGEADPVRIVPGLTVLSGTRNGHGSFVLRVLRPASASQYARIVELVRAAQADKAPLQRLADRYAVWFTPFTLVLCVIAYAITHDWMRVLAVLAVATPCPLILATPIAIIGGINRAAQQLVIVKSGGALERLSNIDIVAFDKTGTLTFGTPGVRELRVRGAMSRDQLMAYASSVENHSSHALARVVIQMARQSGVPMLPCNDPIETPGDGIVGTVDGHRIHVGSRTYALQHSGNDVEGVEALRPATAAMTAYVVVDGAVAGAYEFEDVLRDDARDTLRSLAAMGLSVVLISGDDVPTVRALALSLGIENFHGDVEPAHKAQLIEQLRRDGSRVMMVGDGVNDAVALSVADVGAAMATSGVNVSTEAADVIILANSLNRIPVLLQIGRRTRRIAVQSIRVGLGLSAIGMAFAAFGALTPIAGAIFQEVIDVAVILNALRTSASGHQSSHPVAG